MPRRVLHDVYPAELRIGDEVFENTRVVVTEDIALFYRTGGGKAWVERREELLTRTAPDRPGGSYTTVMASGDTWTFRKTGGCGCGSSLRRVSVAADIADTITMTTDV